MATIDDISIDNFSDLSDEQLLELVKGVRSRRRTPDAEIKNASVKKAIAKKKTGKADALKDVSSLTKNISAEEAAKILKILGA